MNGYYKLVAEQLRKHGYSILRQGSTSHQIWSNGTKSVTVSTNCYSRHTANGIMRQADIVHRFK
jgi:predicted RNA binding protein YcfA (HicA-like mRNA interferase family)